MDLHIYDIKLSPEDVVIVTGPVAQEEIASFSAYLKVIQSIFPNPVIYIPDDSTIDAMAPDSVSALLKDAMTPEAISKLSSIVNYALAEQATELSEKAVADEEDASKEDPVSEI